MKGRGLEIKIRNSKDFYAGLIFIFFGGIALFVARNYPMGTAARMGAGYFPCVLGGILTILGLIITVRSLWMYGEKFETWAWRPLLCVLGAVLGFSFLVDPLGLILATLVLVVISSLGGFEFNILEVVVLYLVLAALVVSVFKYGLGIPISVWPP